MTTPAEAATASIASKATAAGGGVAFFAGLTSHEVIAWAGLAVAIAGFVTNLVFKLDARRRAKVEHEARIERIRRGRRTDTGLVPLFDEDET